MSVFKDLTGSRFGRLVVLSRVSNINGRTAWLCKGDCGSEKVVTGISLTSGSTKSCGCLDVAHNGSKEELGIKKFISRIVGCEATKEKNT